jgi:tetratricopeptide (TPR) repeat protein
MSSTLVKHNPSFQTDDELIGSFVVRRELLEFILELIRENAARPTEPPHHMLIVGPRGSGKTMLVHRVAAEIRQHPGTYDSWYPITFSEEAYQVSSPGEFWLEAIFHLADQTRDTRWEQTHADLLREPDERRLAERCLAQLLDFSAGKGKRLLLVAENLNVLLGEQISPAAAWELRHTLQNETRIMLLGTATVRFQEIDNIDKAWFELLSVRSLDPLTAAECGSLWGSVTNETIEPRRLRAIEILTGGNPRLIKVLAGFAAKRSFRELMEQLVQLIDDHTEYFKSLLDNLPAMERKIFSALLDAWDPVAARDVAQATRLTPSEASALLSRLVSRGAVQVLEESPRRKTYQAAERLFNIYYLMRRRGHPSNRVRAVVDFMVQFYDPPVLADIAKGISSDAQSASRDQLHDCFTVLEDVCKRAPDPRVRREFIMGIDPGFFRLPETPHLLIDYRNSLYFDSPELAIPKPSVRGKRRAIVEQAWQAGCAALSQPYGLRDPEKVLGAIQLLEAATSVSKKPYQLVAVLAECYADQERYDEASACFAFASRNAPKDNWAKAHSARLEFTGGRLEEAERLLREVLQDDERYVWAWGVLGDVLRAKSDYPAAENAYRRILAVSPNHDKAWTRLGRLLQEKLHRYVEAEQAYRKAISIDEKYAGAWAQLGGLLRTLKRYPEAEEAYRKAISVDDKYAWAWTQLGGLLQTLERYPEAEEAYRKAISIDDKDAWAWIELGGLLGTLKRYPEAEEVYRKAASIDEKHACPWVRLGEFLHEELKRYPEAEEAYRKAVSINERDAWAWTQLAGLLRTLKRYPEAEEAYRKAASIDEKHACPWAHLGEFLEEELKRYPEAEEAYQKAVSINERYAWAWFRLGRLLHGQPGRLADATQAYERSIACATTGTVSDVWSLLGILCLDNGKPAEARKAFGKAVEELVNELTRGAVRPGSEDFRVAVASAAAAGYLPVLLERVKESSVATTVEPIVIAFRLLLGEMPPVATEILEIGKDVAREVLAGVEALRREGTHNWQFAQLTTDFGS